MWCKTYGDCCAMRALNEQELAARMQEQMRMMQNTDRAVLYTSLLANYRMPVYVPEGWAEWFAHGDGVV